MDNNQVSILLLLCFLFLVVASSMLILPEILHQREVCESMNGVVIKGSPEFCWLNNELIPIEVL